jgi:O-antigen biosynthesis protein WbqP
MITEQYDKNGVEIMSENRITKIGKILRKTSLDELPQLFNVLVGDMSLVGPRPLVVEEGEIHYLRQRCGVYRLRPGITGLSQISGRDDIGDIEKVRLDTRYVRHVSFGSDARIIFGTLRHAATGR